MPFVRFSRDKRGYEHLYLIESITRRGKSRHRILYWYRTPPGVKIGRLPFDELVKRTLEAQHPSVSFDWQKLIDTPIPPPAPDVERWRERRRAEKAAKQAAAAEAATDLAEQASEETPQPADTVRVIVERAGDVDSTPVPGGGAPPVSVRKRRRRGRKDRLAVAARNATDAVMPPAGDESGAESDDE